MKPSFSLPGIIRTVHVLGILEEAHFFVAHLE